IRCSDILGRSGEALTSVLNSETSSLRELHLTVNTLDLSWNKLEDSGVKRLSALLENPECKVKGLRLGGCGVSDEGCAALASALRSNPSHLRDLDLSWNKVGDSGVKFLSAVLENPHCKLEILRGRRQTEDASKKLFMDGNLRFENSKVSFYQDFSAAVLRKRREFDSAKHRLQEIGARHAMFYPAKLRVTIGNTTKVLCTPAAVLKVITQKEQHVRPAANDRSPPLNSVSDS
ncbi:NACHT, LRR and PYD domains-containing protein 12-like, partial [Silurus meridionalis]